jgi:glycosyltransferase involved in cell wall biosynthesis
LDRESYEYEVAYILPHKNDLVHEFEAAGIPVFCVGGRKPYDPRFLFRLVKLLKERQVDLVHIHLPYAGIFGRIAARLANVKATVYTEHNVIDGYKPMTRLLDQLTYRFDSTTITVSESVRESVLRSKFFKPNKVMTVLNGVDIGRVKIADQAEVAKIRESLGIPREDFVVGNVAHIRPLKGQQYLIRAAKIVVDECPNTTFVIVGREKTPEARQALEDLAVELGIKDKVIFTGFREDAVSITAACDLFALSSLFEGLPVALLEAMALGKPPVVTAVGGIPEVVTDGVEGFLVEPRDCEALAQRILTLIKGGLYTSRKVSLASSYRQASTLHQIYNPRLKIATCAARCQSGPPKR